MYICATYIITQQIVGQLLRHSLCEGCYQNSFLLFYALMYLLHQVVHLIQAWAYFYDRVEQSGRTYHLFYYHAFALLQFIFRRSGAYINNLFGKFLKFLEFQRTVVHSRRKSESVLHQVFFSRLVASVHRSYLRYTYVTLVYHYQEIIWEKVE